ncbi:MAG: tRNA (guanosine(37)-N1)-methyltransferase TrmD [Candidatus Taylorbacteria bacterium]|nr:tRNA (guanosine(37)-N1)-methyltransferase TrmD [Candidatus Taylorbacteria bacterium]
MTFHIISLFPQSFDSYLGESILKRAIEDKKIKVKFYNPREFLPKKMLKTYAGRRVDGKPYGGGPGMVIEALPVIRAIEKVLKTKHSVFGLKKTKIVWLSPSGKQFDTEYAGKIAEKYEHVIIICGRYEGIDARVKKIFKVEEISVGPYVLTGGELPAMIMMDCISRQVEGVLGNFNSREESRIASSDVYTRPEVLEYKGKNYKVPKILLSGHRAKIEEWKKSQQS